MNVEDQASVHRWIDETFPGTDPDSPRKSLRLLEEVVELCLASGAGPHDVEIATARALAASDASQSILGGWTGEGTLQPDKIPAEAADVLIVLYGLAGMRGIDLGAEVDRKMAINRARRWRAMGDGTGYHVKEGVSP